MRLGKFIEALQEVYHEFGDRPVYVETETEVEYVLKIDTDTFDSEEGKCVIIIGDRA